MSLNTLKLSTHLSLKKIYFKNNYIFCRFSILSFLHFRFPPLIPSNQTEFFPSKLNFYYAPIFPNYFISYYFYSSELNLP